jgi:hypothetical protein
VNYDDRERAVIKAAFRADSPWRTRVVVVAREDADGPVETVVFGPLDDQLMAMVRREEWMVDLWWLFTRWVQRTRALAGLLARLVETATLHASPPADGNSPTPPRATDRDPVPLVSQLVEDLDIAPAAPPVGGAALVAA